VEGTVRDQAEAFLCHRERSGDVLSTPRLFESWSASKQLTVADREAIRREVQSRTWCSRAGVRKSLWAAQWRSTNRRDGPTTHLLAGNWLTPALFPTRGAARAWIEVHYGYIRSRPDLRSEPHGWRMPRAVRVRLTVRAE
jgi:hypothetical protein